MTFDPPPLDWREALAHRLGQRPRRIGLWAELALYGARQCLDAAGETALPPGARVRVASLSGPRSAMRASVGQLATGLPMPFSFMQSQPALMLAALGQSLAWHGDAAFVAGRDAVAVQRFALRGAGPDGVLLGWVEEGAEQADPLRTEWWRLRPA
ncbi:MAG: hypothetical protein EOP81_07170 [Variovorax sp.]|nr:MAG: hypothetical protein EOP81_07170 [Variovorax sp.]